MPLRPPLPPLVLVLALVLSRLAQLPAPLVKAEGRQKKRAREGTRLRPFRSTPLLTPLLKPRREARGIPTEWCFRQSLPSRRRG